MTGVQTCALPICFPVTIKKADTKVSIVNADNIVEATNLIKEQQLSEQSKRGLNEAEKNYKIRVTAIQDAIERLTNAKETESWYLSRSIEMETHKLSKEAEKLMKEIDGLEVDNDVKRRTADMIVEQTRQNIKSTDEEIFNQFDVNVFGLIKTTREVLPYMRKENYGVIINISSFLGKMGLVS